MITRNNNHLLLFAQHNDKGCSFNIYNLPNELVHEILVSKDILDKFSHALSLASNGQLTKLKALLKLHPELIIFRGDVVIPGGLIVKHTTLLECALLGGDPEMATMILPFYNQLDHGQEEKERQLAQCLQSITSSSHQEPYDLTTLINIIKNSPDTAVKAALNKEMDHDDELCKALNAFRDAVNPQTITTQNMHYNYQTLILAFKLLENEWDNLKHGNNFDRNDLVWRQVIGYLQRSLPAVERFTFSRGPYNCKKDGEVFERSTQYKYGEDSFPDTAVETDFTGLGFDYGIWAMYGPRTEAIVSNISDVVKQSFQSKFECLQNLCSNNLLCITKDYSKKDSNSYV